MSTMMNPRLASARARVPQLAEAATVRARLALVPSSATSAPRTPFAVLLFALLVAGVVGLLMFNTHMQQNAFKASELSATAEAMKAEKQGLNMELQQLRDPQRVAQAARDLGMVLPSTPAFLRLSDGTVVGKAGAANPDEGLFVRNFPARLPAALKPPPRIVKVKAVIAPKPSPRTSTSDRRASSSATDAASKKKTTDATANRD